MPVALETLAEDVRRGDVRAVARAITLVENDALEIEPGEYLALLSHSGSRGTGAAVCEHYSRLAMNAHRELPKEMRHLSWLDLDTPEGREYWDAMELMGRYASANHELIHKHVRKKLGADLVFDVENHHNFAWKERHFGRDVVVHRKGATPADAGVLGIIPGSMASPAFVVRGRGVYNAAMLTKKVEWSRGGEHYSGPLTREALLAALEDMQRQFLASLDSVDAAVPIHYGDTPFTFDNVLYEMVQHESIHHGQWSVYAAVAGFDTPKSWQTGWKM